MSPAQEFREYHFLCSDIQAEEIRPKCLFGGKQHEIITFHRLAIGYDIETATIWFLFISRILFRNGFSKMSGNFQTGKF